MSATIVGHLSKSQMIREAWKSGLRSNKEVADFVKKTYNVEISSNYVSVVKSHDKDKPTVGKRIIAGLSEFYKDIETIRVLVSKYGADEVRTMIANVSQRN